MGKKGAEKNIKETYFSKFRSSIKQSLKYKKGFVTAVLDIILSVLLFGIIILAVLLSVSLIVDKASEVGGLTEILETGISQLAIQALPLILIIIAISLIVSFLFYGFFKALIWKKIFEKEFTIKYYFKFLALLLIWLFAFAIIITPFSIVLKNYQQISSIITTILQLLIMHFFALSVFYLAQDNALFNGINKAFKTGIKLHLFILPYIYMLIISIITIIIIYIIGVYAILPAVGITTAELQMIGFQALATGSFTQLLTTLLKAAIPILVIMIIIGAFVNAYLRIFYKEFVSRV